MTEYVRIHLILPEHIKEAFQDYNASGDKASRNQLIAGLYRERWTLESIAQACGGLTRERVRQIARNNREKPYTLDLEIPKPPTKPVKEKRTYNEPRPEVLRRLLELQPFAQRVRSNSPEFRAESEEYTALVHKSFSEDGVSIYRLAKRLGITHSALQFRLVRYGYRKASDKAKSRVYNPIKTANRQK